MKRYEIEVEPLYVVNMKDMVTNYTTDVYEKTKINLICTIINADAFVAKPKSFPIHPKHYTPSIIIIDNTEDIDDDKFETAVYMFAEKVAKNTNVNMIGFKSYYVHDNKKDLYKRMIVEELGLEKEDSDDTSCNITITSDIIEASEVFGFNTELNTYLNKLICRSTIKIDTKDKKIIINCSDTAKENADVVIRDAIPILTKSRNYIGGLTSDINILLKDNKLLLLSFVKIMEYHFLEDDSLIMIFEFVDLKEYYIDKEEYDIKVKDFSSNCITLPSDCKCKSNKINTDIIAFFNPQFFKISTAYDPSVTIIKANGENISNIVKDINFLFNPCKKEKDSGIERNISINDTLNIISLEYDTEDKYESLNLKTLYSDIQNILSDIGMSRICYNIIINNDIVINKAVIINTKYTEEEDGEYRLNIIFKYETKYCNNAVEESKPCCNFNDGRLNQFSYDNIHVDNFVASTELLNDMDYYEHYTFISSLNILYPKCDSVVISYNHNKIIMRAKESNFNTSLFRDIYLYIFNYFDTISDIPFNVFINEIKNIKGESIINSYIRFDSVRIDSVDYHHSKDYDLEIVLSYKDYTVLRSDVISGSEEDEKNEEVDELIDTLPIINYEDIEFIDFENYDIIPKFKSISVYDIIYQKLITDSLYFHTDNKYTLNIDEGEILVELSDSALKEKITSSLVLLGTNVVFDGSINDLINENTHKMKMTKRIFDVYNLCISIELKRKIKFVKDDVVVCGNMIDICPSSIEYDRKDLSKFTINYTKGDIEVYNK